MCIILCLFTYLLSLLIWSLVLSAKLPHKKTLLLVPGFIAIILHAVLLHHWIDAPSGQNLTFFNMLSLALWVIALMVLILSFKRLLENLMVIVFPLAIISILLIAFFPAENKVNTAQNPKELFHILLALITFSIFCLAGFQSLLLSLQEWQLRYRRASILQLLPALEIMEKLLFQLLSVTFVSLSMLLATSFYFYYHLFTLLLLPKITMAIIAWLILGMLLIGRHYFGWRGRKAIYGTLSGGLLVLLLYFGVAPS